MLSKEILEYIKIAKKEGWQDLDLSARELTEIPQIVTSLPELRYLRLRNNKITTIPEEISKLKKLTLLSLDNNQIEEIPDFLFDLSDLEEIYLRNNQIKKIPNKLDKEVDLKNIKLKVLDLSRNYLSQVPEFIGKLPRLHKLDLRENKLPIPQKTLESSVHSVNTIFNYLKVLKLIENVYKSDEDELDLSEKGLIEIPKEIEVLSSLKTLKLNENRIQEISTSVLSLTNIKVLELKSNKITDIPESISKLAYLEVLDLFGNNITVIPESISELTNLSYLNLSKNEITVIPESFIKLNNLTQLYLSKNKIKKLSKFIGGLTKLEKFAIQENQINDIPQEVVNLKKLTYLSLSRNQIKIIPQEVFDLRELAQLSLNNNQIIELPQKIGCLSNMQVLALHQNHIKYIPEEIGNLKKLTTLYLHNNEIEQLPQSIGKLASLKVLDLSDNKISEIPDTFDGLSSIEELNLSNNNLPIPSEILASKQDVTKLFNYLKQIRQGLRPLHEAKLILTGQGNVGKTSIIQRLLYNRYRSDENMTEGVKVDNWKVQLDTKDIILNVWDFGGQEIYHSTHQFFLTQRSLYILVCDCRSSEEANCIEYWLKMIEIFGNKSPVIIVGNKKDQQHFDINRKALRNKYPNICSIIETSCQTNEGIEGLRNAIFEQIAKMKEVYDLLPLTWFEVKEKLENMNEDFISYNRYIGICHKSGISEETEQELLVELLHQIGAVLHFRNHPILQSTNVLKPQWLTEGIYALLSNEYIKSAKGIFTYDDIEQILNPIRYPSNCHKYLVELMKGFEICFEIKQFRFLIPAILPKTESLDTELDADTLEFQYHYRFLPNSIISRFIVLMSDYIHGQNYWRSGVMLQYVEGKNTCNLALVKSDSEDKKISIAISGFQETRRSFLSVIRSIFKKIHDNFPNIEVTEWIKVPNHPEHPLLDYQELLSLEAIGESTITLGKLRLKLDLQSLLDGYEAILNRQTNVTKTINYEDISIQKILGDKVDLDIKKLVEEET